ncbi:hypothetical protein SAMN05660242_3386 [Thermoanaerobacterium sp. RBIITD]|nr:hypothetical protein SAMN05660242_3386 [Thermoanaerobacterium sp. RBIITD]
MEFLTQGERVRKIRKMLKWMTQSINKILDSISFFKLTFCIT